MGVQSSDSVRMNEVSTNMTESEFYPPGQRWNTVLAIEYDLYDTFPVCAKKNSSDSVREWEEFFSNRLCAIKQNLIFTVYLFFTESVLLSFKGASAGSFC